MMCCSTGRFTYSVKLQALKKGVPSHKYGAFVMGFVLHFHRRVHMSDIHSIAKC